MDIGLILGAFGIKGEVRILSFTDEPERFLELKEVILVDPDNESELKYEIEKVRVHKRNALVKFREVKDRTQAEKFEGTYVRLVGSIMTVVEEVRIINDKLIGMEIFTKSGERLGVLEEVIQTGANEVYEVRDGERSILLPAICEVILEIDLEHGRMVVDPLPGLL
ncbi:MAG: ribosome maturation factor RimM [bacterium]|nr:ribosome maturation factor RimM [bacterium]